MSITVSPVLSSEYLLHYIWRTKQFERINLFLTDGRKIEIIDFGRYNTNSGPDFLHGKVRVGNTILAGHIEMHLKSSDWEAHNHQSDPAYNSVILHVVGIHDREVNNYNDHQLITLEIGTLIDENISSKFELLNRNHDEIHCSGLNPARVQESIWTIWKERLNIERLQGRVNWVNELMESSKNDWEAIMYRQLFMSMGTNVNKEAFNFLAERIDHKIFMKVRHDELMSHALVFGMAGMLEKKFEEEYPKLLQNTFRFLQNKFELQPLNPVIWKYSKMHPHNFPDLRIAQAVEIMRRNDHFFSQIANAPQIENIRQLLKLNELPEYWNDHFILGHKSVPRTKKLGKNSIDLIIINGIIPVLFMYGHQQHLVQLQEKALEILSEMPQEQNYIIRQWETLNIGSTNAQDSQALIQLKKNYCDHSKCLQCSIGHELLKKQN